MTRKDYQLIAKGLKLAKPDTGMHAAGRSQWRYAVVCVADELAKANDRFNTETFLEACGF